MEDNVDGKVTIGPEALRELVEQAIALSADYGEEVHAAVLASAEEPLEAERATRLYTRVLEILRGADSDVLSDEDRARLAAEIRREVQKLVVAVDRPARRDGSHGLGFVTRDGLEERDVVPTPHFNGRAIPMKEGYVNIEQLKLWPDNHRLELHVLDFREHYGRDPDDEELVRIMQGKVHLPSLDKTDPFKLVPLARSIARKGVQQPPIVTHDGEPLDGNRRIAASLLVLYGKDYSDEERERARYIRVWRAAKKLTPDQVEAIVVAQNFESDYKEPWPEYIKARLVSEQYELLKEELKGRYTTGHLKRIREDVAKRFAIKPDEVTRYVRMVGWADDFSAYHEGEGRDRAEVQHRADEIFQWFYEIDAGKEGEKLKNRIDVDDDLKSKVYEMMFDLFDTGAQVRYLHKVLAYPETWQMFEKAYEMMGRSPDQALELVDDAIDIAKRKSRRGRAVAFDQFVRGVVERLGATAPDQWATLDAQLLLDTRRAFMSALGLIRAQLKAGEGVGGR